MKKYLGRIMSIVITLVLGYQNYSYADVIVNREPIYTTTIWFRIISIGMVVIILSILAFLSLKIVVKKEEKANYDGNLDKKCKLSKKIESVIYILAIIIELMLVISISAGLESMIVLFIFIILNIISIIFRIIKKKKVSYITYGFIILAIAIILFTRYAYVMKRKTYNNQFEQFVELNLEGGIWHEQYISNVEALIETMINNNAGKRKVSLVYKNITYTSVNELNSLLEEIDLEERYFIDIDREGYDRNGYIESITLTTYEQIIKGYEGIQEEDDVQLLIMEIEDICEKYDDYPTKIIYNSYKNGRRIINVDKNNFDEINEFRKEFSGFEKFYNVEIEIKNNKYYIIITENS